MAEPTKAERDTLDLVERLWTEATSGLHFSIDGDTLWDIRVRNARRFLGDAWDTDPRPGMKHVVLNRTGSSILTTVSVQTEQPLRLKISPFETGDEPLYYLTGRGVRMVNRARTEGALDLGDVGEDELQPGVELPPEIGETVEALTREQVDPLTGAPMPALLEHGRDLITVDDNLVATEMQSLGEAKFREAYWDYYATELTTLSNVTGDQGLLYEWDAEAARAYLHCPNWTNVRFDPRSTWVDNAGYVMFDQLLTKEAAIKQFPKHREAIKRIATDAPQGERPDVGSDGRKEGGQESWVSVIGDTDPSQSIETTQKMVTVRTLWRRNEDFPMEAPDAAEKGLISESTDPEQMGLFVLPNGDTVNPDQARWPKRKGLRQVQVIVEADLIVFDDECPYTDIPMPWMKNIPIQYSPYGQGEPFRLEDISQTINRILSLIEDSLRYNAHAEEIFPESVATALKARFDDFRSHPGQIRVLPDDVYEDYVMDRQRQGFAVDGPTIPDSWIRLLQTLIHEHQKLAGDTDVFQGEPPGADVSGVAIDTLQASGSRVMAYKARSLEWTFTWVAKLMLDSIVKWMPDDQWELYLSKYGAAVRNAIKKKAKRMKYDVIVEAVAGRAAKEQETLQRASLMQNHISGESYLEMLGHPDPRGETRKFEEQQKRRLAPQQGVESPGSDVPA